MLSSLLVVLALAAPPGDASRLAPGPRPVAPEVIATVPDAPTGDSGGLPALPAGGAIAAVAVAVIAAVRRRASLFTSSPATALGLQPPDDVIVVFVPGYGSSSSAETFGDLIDLMGLSEDQVRHFDYRWVGEGFDHAEAARTADVEDAAAALAGFTTGVAGGGREVHLVGHSKGGAIIAEMIEQWDRGRLPAVDGVTGATLLDPPLASGIHGLGQSAGVVLDWLYERLPFVDLPGLPHDGGYNPVECSVGVFDCTDHRNGLGQASGVDVAVVRAPDAAVTNFKDVPDGMSVYEVDTPGPSAVDAFPNPFAVLGAIVGAHKAVLHHPDVAACVVSRMSAEPCDLTDLSRPPNIAALSDRTGGTAFVKVV
ncbi:MAG TPA: alpha/beta fold hydrolase [Acidimicrobiia bacterium]|nr:alpha/beta fold hydrolase [Acidimicrobiia bacterium]